MRRREAPIRRVYASGKVVWIARYTARDGRRRIAKPRWNRGFGSFTRKRDAQRAIEEAYGIPDDQRTLRDYFSDWTDRYPRSERTNATNHHRIGRVIDVEVEGLALGSWPIDELRRRHAVVLVDHMLRAQGRATTGAAAILRSLSAMAEDAINRRSHGRQSVQGDQDPGQRPTRDEGAPPCPGLRLRGNAPLRAVGRPLRDDGSGLH